MSNNSNSNCNCKRKYEVRKARFLTNIHDSEKIAPAPNNGSHTQAYHNLNRGLKINNYRKAIRDHESERRKSA